MESTVKEEKNSFFRTAYQVYHFVAKVLLYSVLIILILVAIGVVAYFIDLQRNVKSGVNKPPLLGAYIIISPSMEPTIKVEDAIITLRQEAKELEVGDIITFLSSDPRYSGLTITHRIVGIEKSKNGDIFFRTKGDNNNTEDTALVSAKNVFGRVILKIPKIGYIQSLLMQSYGWIIIVVIPCLCIVGYDIIKLVKSIKSSVLNTNKKKEKADQVDLIESDQDRLEEEKRRKEEKEKLEEELRQEEEKRLEEQKQIEEQKKQEEKEEEEEIEII